MENPDIKHNIETIMNSIFSLPVRQEGKSDFFPVMLEELFNEYQQLALSLKGQARDIFDSSQPLVTETINATHECIDLYFRGHVELAYKAIAKIFDAHRDSIIFEFKSQPLDDEVLESEAEKLLPGIDYRNTYLYRARIEHDIHNAVLNYRNMFHVPFDLRHVVTTQRYSIPGLPCLYLSQSVYGCWKELGKPDLNQFHVSKLKLNKPVFRFVNLACETARRTASFAHMNYLHAEGIRLEEGHKYLADFVIKWPIIAACSICTKHSNASFKPEYIIPQFLLQWAVSTADVDGIQYFSTKIERNQVESELSEINYAIPVKSNKSNGYCDRLISEFEISDPISLQSMMILEPHIFAQPPLEFPASMMTRNGFYVAHNRTPKNGGFPSQLPAYSNTIFGKMEHVLKGLDTFELNGFN